MQPDMIEVCLRRLDDLHVLERGSSSAYDHSESRSLLIVGELFYVIIIIIAWRCARTLVLILL